MTPLQLRRKLPLISIGLLLLGICGSPAMAETCGGAIQRAQAAVDDALARQADAGPFARESSFATLGHQPTPASVARAEASLHGGSGGEEAAAALDRARDADAAGNAPECFKAVQEARRAAVLRSD